MYCEIEIPACEYVLEPKYVKEFEKNPSCIPPFGIRIGAHVKEAKINLGGICDFPKFADQPPCTYHTPEVRFDLAAYSKEFTSSLAYKGLYRELILKYHKHKKIFTDGVTSENGVTASAVLLSRDVKESSQCIPTDSSVYELD